MHKGQVSKEFLEAVYTILIAEMGINPAPQTAEAKKVRFMADWEMNWQDKWYPSTISQFGGGIKVLRHIFQGKLMQVKVDSYKEDPKRVNSVNMLLAELLKKERTPQCQVAA